MADIGNGLSSRDDDLGRLGARVRQLRHREALTQQQLADAVSLTRATINRFEAGKTDVSVSRLFAIARVLNVEPAALFDLSDVSS